MAESSQRAIILAEFEEVNKVRAQLLRRFINLRLNGAHRGFLGIRSHVVGATKSCRTRRNLIRLGSNRIS
eukprot:5803821-Amphidinium_carterae.2